MIINAVIAVTMYKVVGFELTVLWLGIMIRFDLNNIRTKVTKW